MDYSILQDCHDGVEKELSEMKHMIKTYIKDMEYLIDSDSPGEFFAAYIRKHMPDLLLFEKYFAEIDEYIPYIENSHWKMHTAHESMLKEIKPLKNELADVKKEIEENKNYIEELEHERDDLENEIYSLRQKNDNLDSLTDDLYEQIKEQELITKPLQEEIESHNECMERIIAERDEADNANWTLQCKIDELKKELEDYKGFMKEDV